MLGFFISQTGTVGFEVIVVFWLVWVLWIVVMLLLLLIAASFELVMVGVLVLAFLLGFAY